MIETSFGIEFSFFLIIRKLSKTPTITQEIIPRELVMANRISAKINNVRLLWRTALTAKKKKKTVNKSPVNITNWVNNEVSIITSNKAQYIESDLMKNPVNLYNCHTRPRANGSIARCPTAR
ncbi:hypothetical protein ES708_31155 [subsurface metagenome]